MRAAVATDVEPTEAEAWALLLSVEGLGPASFGALLAAYGSAPAILAAAHRRGAARSFAALAAAAQGRSSVDDGLGGRIVELAAAPGPWLRVLRASGLRIVTLDDPGYPARLRAIELPPPVLLVRGNLDALSAGGAIAVVGTRRPSERGRLVAARIAAAVARAGGVVVSGLAVGIDGSAHAAVVAEGRSTIAVLGSGHDRLYPRAHRRLAEEIRDTGGAVVSEWWPERPASRATFPLRNRVISGLADATVVVEAGVRSGALITAAWALEQGRECFVVPGPLDDPRSAGCLAWYRAYGDVTHLVTGIPDLLVDLGLTPPDPGAGSAARGRRPSGGRARLRPDSVTAELIELGPTAREIAEALIRGHGSIDDLVAATGHAPATVLGAITLLETCGLATSTYGRYRAVGRLASLPPAGVGASVRRAGRVRGPRPAAREDRAAGLPPPVDPC